jgi:hypothetical protein
MPGLWQRSRDAAARISTLIVTNLTGDAPGENTACLRSFRPSAEPDVQK